MEPIRLPNSVIQTLHNQFPEYAETVIEAHSKSANSTARLHSKKHFPIPEDWVLKNSELHIYDVPKSFSVILDPNWHAGAYYMQEASSACVGYYFKQYILPNLNKNAIILDACAAPGGKSTDILNALDGKGILIANEVHPKRYGILVENLARSGYSNCIASRNSIENLVQSPLQYACTIIDAPCSGQGLFRKMPDYHLSYQDVFVQNCASTQANILETLSKQVVSGGYIMYSTCTLDSRENSLQIAQFLALHPEFEIVEIEAKFGSIQVENGIQFLPGVGIGEGFFLSILRKKGDLQIQASTAFTSTQNAFIQAKIPAWMSDASFHTEYKTYILSFETEEEAKLHHYCLEKLVHSRQSMACTAFEKAKEWHPSAENVYRNQSIWAETARVKLNEVSACLSILRKDSSYVPPAPINSKWCVLEWNGYGIACGKHLGNRLNSGLPDSWRILKQK